MKATQALTVLAAGVGVALGSFGAAQAAGALNTGPAATVGASATAVPATAAGLPPTAQVMYAVVNSDGSLARGFQAMTATRVAAGAYEVSFRHAVNQCAYVVTPGLSGNTGVPSTGQASVITAHDNPKAVFVTTYDSSSSQADLGFHVIVAC